VLRGLADAVAAQPATSRDRLTAITTDRRIALVPLPAVPFPGFRHSLDVSPQREVAPKVISTAEACRRPATSADAVPL
jgi:hypothetical protein